MEKQQEKETLQEYYQESLYALGWERGLFRGFIAGATVVLSIWAVSVIFGV